jgi:hypothetical protein
MKAGQKKLSISELSDDQEPMLNGTLLDPRSPPESGIARSELIEVHPTVTIEDQVLGPLGVNGTLFLLTTYFTGSLYAAVISKWLPDTGIWVDFSFCAQIPWKWSIQRRCIPLLS